MNFKSERDEMGLGLGCRRQMDDGPSLVQVELLQWQSFCSSVTCSFGGVPTARLVTSILVQAPPLFPPFLFLSTE